MEKERTVKRKPKKIITLEMIMTFEKNLVMGCFLSPQDNTECSNKDDLIQKGEHDSKL